MSICPDKDMHSVYLDNELKEPFLEQYEAHLSNCLECKKTYLSFKKVHDAVVSDANSIAPDSIFMEQSFRRLQSRLKYEQVTGKSRRLEFPLARWSVPAVAAAALLLAVAVPLGMFQSVTAKTASVDLAPLSVIQTAISIPDAGVVSDGAVSSKSFATLLNTADGIKSTSAVSSNSVVAQNVSSRSSYSTGSAEKAFVPFILSASDKETSSVSIQNAKLYSIDVFRPSFDTNQSESTINLAITPVSVVRFANTSFGIIENSDIKLIVKRLDSQR